MKVEDVMQRRVVSVGENDLVTHTRQIMRDYRYQMLPVVDENDHLIGIVTEKDAMRVTSTRSNVTVGGFVSEVALVTPADDLRSVLHHMAELRLRYLPVVREREDPVLIGLIGLPSIFNALKERVPDRKVSDVMITDIKTCQKSDTLNKVWSDLLKFGISEMPVMDGNEAIGVITVRDILKSGHVRLDREARHVRHVKAEKVMNTPLHTISRDESVKTATERLLTLGISRIYVVEKEELAGVVDLYDLITLFANSL
ncbi:MAG: CBS domain-containing protein [Methanosarcinales archaeon]